MYHKLFDIAKQGYIIVLITKHNNFEQKLVVADNSAWTHKNPAPPIGYTSGYSNEALLSLFKTGELVLANDDPNDILKTLL